VYLWTTTDSGLQGSELRVRNLSQHKDRTQHISDITHQTIHN